jgi:hypothetical protein
VGKSTLVSRGWAWLPSRVVGLLATAVLLGGIVALIVSGPAISRGAAPASASATGGGTSASPVLHQASALTLALSPDHQTITMNFLGNQLHPAEQVRGL